MNNHNQLPLALLLLRLSVFLVMLMWTIDKFIRPDHAAAVYQHFYLIGGLGKSLFMAIGILELVLLVAFVAGLFKRYTYGAVLILHAISTVASYQQYFAPFADVNLLFYAAWPMLAACFTLYVLRDQDTLWTVKR